MRTSVLAVLSALVAVTAPLSPGLEAQDMAEVTGLWAGEIQAQGASLQIIFLIEMNTDGEYVGTVSVPVQGVSGVALSSVTIQDATVILEMTGFQASYRGTVVGDEMQGTWSQAGNSVELNMMRTTEDALMAEEEVGVGGGLSGEWNGNLNAGTAILPLVFTLERRADDTYFGHVVSPSQGSGEIPMTAVSVAGEEITIEIAGIGASFTGTISGDTIEGTFTQAATDRPLTITRGGEGPVAPVRPQTPSEPFPYEALEVEFTNPDGGHTLAGTLTVPVGSGPFPAVILITGSGAQDRDESIAGHRPFLVLADHLTRNGIAVLRYDDRGVGESTGDFASATTFDLAEDASSALAYLRTRPEIDGEAVGAIGHSEGGLIASMLATDASLGFAVLLAGPGLVGEELLYAQGDAVLAANGGSAEMRHLNRSMQETLFSGAKDGLSTEALAEKLEYRIDQMSEQERATVGIRTENRATIVAQQTAAVTSPWFRTFLTLDPADHLRKARAPVLALIGEHDLQVPHEANASAIESALQEAGAAPFQVHVLPGLNHLFQTSTTGSPNEYATIEETMSPMALDLVTRWILQQRNAR